MNIPHNLDAEKAVLGAMMLSREAISVARDMLTATDFYHSASAHIFDAIGAVADEGGTPDAVAIAERLDRWGLLDQVGGKAKLLGIQADTPAASNAGHYAKIVAETGALRRIIEAATVIREDAMSHPQDVGGFLEESQARLEAIPLATREVDPAPDIEAFVGERDEPVRWLIPDLIAERDKTLLCAGEGTGKSTLLGQVGVCGAAGLHPFRRVFIEPIRVMVVDLECSPGVVRRRLRPLWIRAKQEATETPDPSNLRVVVREEGIDLTKRPDAIWLEEQIAAAEPDLVCFGPLYKTYRGKAGDPLEPAFAAGNVIDRLRKVYDTAWLVETHAPMAASGQKRDLRPYGSAHWMFWPECGVSIRLDGDRRADVEMYRPPREPRPAWPTAFRRGGEWPWWPMP